MLRVLFPELEEWCFCGRSRARTVSVGGSTGSIPSSSGSTPGLPLRVRCFEVCSLLQFVNADCSF